MFPIILTTSLSGNVGKTTLTRNLLVPNLPGVKVFAVEDINAGYVSGEAIQLSADHTRSILEQAIEASLSGPVVVDVGSSNVSNFFTALQAYEGMHEFIAHVFVPTEPSEKVQTDTISTLHYLTEKLGFDASTIMLVLNKVPARKSTESVFGELMQAAADLGVLTYGEVPESDTFQLASSMGMTVHELAAMNPKEILAKLQEGAKESGDTKDSVRVMLAAASAKKLKAKLDGIFVQMGITVPLE